MEKHGNSEKNLYNAYSVDDAAPGKTFKKKHLRRVVKRIPTRYSVDTGRNNPSDDQSLSVIVDILPHSKTGICEPSSSKASKSNHLVSKKNKIKHSRSKSKDDMNFKRAHGAASQLDNYNKNLHRSKQTFISDDTKQITVSHSKLEQNILSEFGDEYSKKSVKSRIPGQNTEQSAHFLLKLAQLKANAKKNVITEESHGSDDREVKLSTNNFIPPHHYQYHYTPTVSTNNKENIEMQTSSHLKLPNCNSNFLKVTPTKDNHRCLSVKQPNLTEMRNQSYMGTFKKYKQQLDRQEITMLNDSDDVVDVDTNNVPYDKNISEQCSSDIENIGDKNQDTTYYYKRNKVLEIALGFCKKDESIRTILNDRNFLPTYHNVRKKVKFSSDKFSESWGKSMDDMSKKYGAIVRRIFTFYKYAAVINFIYSLLVLILIILPEILLRRGHLVEVPVKYDNCSSGSAKLSKSSLQLQNAAQLINQRSTSANSNSDALSIIRTVFRELFTAEKYLEDTFLFYSYYSGTSLKFSSASYFKIPRRTLYIMTITSIYIITGVPLIFILVTQFVGRSKLYSMNFCKIVFASFDMNKRSERAILDSQDFTRKALIELIKTHKTKYIRSRSDYRVSTIIKRTFVWVLVLVVHVGFIVTIKYVTKFEEQTNISNKVLNKITGGLKPYAFNLAIFGFYLIFPVLFEKLASLENYTSNEMANVTTIRLILFQLFPILCIMFPFKLIASADVCTCKELVVGKLLYAISVTTFLCNLARVLVILPIYTRIVRIYNKRFRPEYSVSSNILTIVYVQAYVIAATPYFLLAPMIGTLYFALFFFVNKLGLKLRHASPPSSTTVTPTALIAILVYAVVITCATQFYIFFFDMKPDNCGFFKHYNSKNLAFDMILNELNLENNNIILQARNLFKPGPFFLFLSGIFSVIIIVMVSNAAFQKNRRKLLKAAISETVGDEPPI